MPTLRREAVPALPGPVRAALRRQGGWLFLLALCAYVLLCNGYLQTNDVAHTLSAARSLVARGDLAVDTAVVPGGGSALGADGRAYAPHGIGMTVLYLPAAVVGGVVPDQTAAWLVPFLASFLNPVAGAVGVWAFFALLRALDVRPAPAVAASLLFGFASIHFVYATISFDVLPTSTALLLGLLGLTRWARGRGGATWDLLGSGVAFASSMLLRLDSVLVVAAAGLGLLVWALRRGGVGQAVRAALVWSVPLLGAVLITGWYNHLRFGSPLDDGHGPDPQVKLDTPLLDGLFGQLASPGKSVFLYTPLLVVGLLGFRALARREPVLAGIVGLASVASLLFHAKLVNWTGDMAWGPRFLVPLTGQLLLPLGPLFDRWGSWRWWWRTAVVVVAVASAGVQWLGVGVNVDAVLFANPGYARVPDQHLVAEQSPLRFHARALYAGIRGEGGYRTGSVTDPATYPVSPARFDVWWLLRPGLQGREVAVAVLAVGLLAGAAGLARTTGRPGRADPPPGREVHRTQPVAA